MSGPPPAALARILTARAVAILTVGTVIGAGVFLVPSAVLRSAGGSVGLATLIWVTGGVLSFLGALTYAELAAMTPGTGGLYLYLRDAFGPAVAFTYGWTLFVVIGSGSVAALCVAATTYLGVLVPVPAGAAPLVAALLALAVSCVNIVETRRGAALLKAGTAIKLAAIAGMVVAFPLLGHGLAAPAPAGPVPEGMALLAATGLGLVSVLWAYEGWQYTTFMAGETIDPQRNFPRGLAFGTLALIGIYVLASLAYVSALGADGVMRSDRVAADAAGLVLGAPWARIIAIPILVSCLTAAQAIAMTSARAYFAMARDGLFFKPLAAIHPRYGTPAVALVSAAGWSAVLAASGTFDVLLQYVVFVGWLFYALGGLAVVALRRKRPDAPRVFRVPLYPVTPLLFAASGLAIVVNTVVHEPLKGAIGLGATAAALPMYALWRRLASRPA